MSFFFGSFWFELSRNVLGVSAGFPEASGVKPHYIALRKFEGNVAHSNYRVGLRTYSDGFRPRENGGRNGQGGPGYAVQLHDLVSSSPVLTLSLFLHLSSFF